MFNWVCYSSRLVEDASLQPFKPLKVQILMYLQSFLVHPERHDGITGCRLQASPSVNSAGATARIKKM